MEIAKIYHIEVTGEELQLIRSSLCNRSMKELCHAHEVQRECEEKGLTDATSHIYLETRDQIRAIIDKIDEVE